MGGRLRRMNNVSPVAISTPSLSVTATSSLLARRARPSGLSEIQPLVASIAGSTLEAEAAGLVGQLLGQRDRLLHRSVRGHPAAWSPDTAVMPTSVVLGIFLVRMRECSPCVGSPDRCGQ